MLDRIVADKRVEVAARIAARPLHTFLREVAPSDRDFVAALCRSHTGFILEVKRASPSQGLIRADFDAAAIACSYAPFADAISVLTDSRYFDGNFEVLRQVRAHAPQPVLCKDFVVDPYQLWEARHHGADAILLMCSVLDPEALEACLRTAREIGIATLVEAHDEVELDRAIAAGAEVIGINNRDLETLRVDRDTTRRLAPRVPADRVLVCESGIRHHRDVVDLRGACDAFLVGTSLMEASDLDRAVRELIFGRVKICGLTTTEAAESAWRAGACFGGLMLWPGSKRHIRVEAARALREIPLSWVGVFVDAEIDEIAAAAETLSLSALQLHGHEDAGYVAALRGRTGRVSIWKAQRVGDPDGRALLHNADRLLLDSWVADARGGTGQRFDWNVVRARPDRDTLILSGGITPDNAPEADALGVWALDLSSGVESMPGHKDERLVAKLFDALRGSGRKRA